MVSILCTIVFVFVRLETFLRDGNLSIASGVHRGVFSLTDPLISSGPVQLMQGLPSPVPRSNLHE